MVHSPEIKDSEGAYFKEIIISSLWAWWVDKIMKSLWVMLEIEGSFTLHLRGFFPFTHSLVNGLCFKSQGCGALLMQKTLSDTCILEIEMRAKFSSEWGDRPWRATKETKQVQVMKLISFLPVFLDSWLIVKGSCWENNYCLYIYWVFWKEYLSILWQVGAPSTWQVAFSKPEGKESIKLGVLCGKIVWLLELFKGWVSEVRKSWTCI